MASPRMLAGCDATQVEAITTPATPLCIVAGAGSGKTRVLTRRIAWRVASGEAAAAHVLALTFTRKAAGEMRGRLAALEVPDRVTAGTFHGVALAQLRRYAADRGRPAPVVLDSKAQLIGRLIDGRGPASSAPPRRGASEGGSGRSAVTEVAAEIEWAKARLVSPRDYPFAARAAGRRPPLGASEIADIFESYEIERRRRGLLDFDDLLTGLTGLVESDPDFAAAQRWRFRHLFVDEFQDLNQAQLRLLRAWLGPSCDLCVVGDPDQAIYGWNGADPGILASVDELWPSITTIRLGTNYRSSPQVLAFGEAALAAGQREQAAPTRRASRADGPVPTVTSYETAEEEAVAVARSLRRAHIPGRRWSQLAVLVRTNAQLPQFAAACLAAGIPHRTMAETSARDHVGPTPERGREAADDPPAPETDQPAGEVAAVPGDAVELTTFHRAKGLEWAVVFVTGLERGLVPIASAQDSDDEAEERRLLYVALTRAEEELHCSWAQRRRRGGVESRREPSPWLPAIEATRAVLLELAGPVGSARRAALAEGRAAVGGDRGAPSGPQGGAAGDLAAALRAWRKATARAARVPDYVVMSDRTLDALAELAPRSMDELLAVPGMGRVKAASYGERVLEVVRAAGGPRP